MKYMQTEKETPILELLSDRAIARINKRFGTHFKKEKNINTVKRKEKSFEWWNKLIRTKPGFDRGEDEK